MKCEKSESTHHNCVDDCFLKDQLFEFHFLIIEPHVSKSSHETKIKKASGRDASFKCLIAGVSNLFSAVGHIYTPGFYTGQTLLKRKLSSQDCISVVPKLFVCRHRNQLIKFRGTPVTALFGDHHCFGQRSREIV